MKKNKNKNNLLAFIVVIVLLIGVAFVAIVSKGFTNMDASTWFEKKSDTPEAKEEVLAVDDQGNKLTGGGNYAMPTSMAFLSAASTTSVDEGILITAKFTPEDASLTRLTWTLDWKTEGVTDEQKTWASDYDSKGLQLNKIIQLTPNVKTCRVKCLTEFGCPIILTCKSVSNPSAYATCQLDYAIRIGDYMPKFIDVDDNVHNMPGDTFNWDFGKSCYLGFYNDYYSDAEKLADRDSWFIYNFGTVKDTYSMKYTITLDDYLYSELNHEGYYGSGVQSKTFESQDLDIYLDTFMTLFGFNEGELTHPEFMDHVGDLIPSNNHVFDITFTFKGTYSTFEKTFKFNKSSWDYATPINSIELTESNLTF